VGQIDGFALAPLVQENASGLLVRHVLVDGDDVDASLRIVRSTGCSSSSSIAKSPSTTTGSC
jgi:hypothetical protein